MELTGTKFNLASVSEHGATWFLTYAALRREVSGVRLDPIYLNLEPIGALSRQGYRPKET